MKIKWKLQFSGFDEVNLENAAVVPVAALVFFLSNEAPLRFSLTSDDDDDKVTLIISSAVCEDSLSLLKWHNFENMKKKIF